MTLFVVILGLRRSGAEAKDLNRNKQFFPLRKKRGVP
jgi:hypothetical protein